MMYEFTERREMILNRISEFKSFNCDKPSGAFYIFPNIEKTGLSSDQLQNLLLNKAGVAILSGKGFGDNGEGFLRISFANNKENIEKAFNRIKEIID